MWHLLQVFFNSAELERKFLLKNHWDFSVMFWLPTLTIFLIWWIFSRSFIVDVPIAVVNYSHGDISNTLIRYLDSSPDINVVENYPNEKMIQENILSRNIYGAVIIPHDFDSNIMQGRSSKVALKVNAQYGTHSGIIQKGVQKSIGTLSAGVEIRSLVKLGIPTGQANIAYSPIQVQRVSLFNTGADYQQFIASTVLPALLHILAMIIGATTIGREVRDKTLDLWYQKINDEHHQKTVGMFDSIEKLTFDKPFQKQKLSFYRFFKLVSGLNGKLIWPMLAYTIWGAICLTLAAQLHDSSIQAWWLTFIAFLLLMMVSFWLGGIVTLTSFSLRKGLSATGFISAPSFAFAGVTYPFIAITSSAKKWALMLPLTHYLNLHVAQLQMNAPISASISIIWGFMLAVVMLMCICVLLTHRALNNPQRWGAR